MLEVCGVQRLELLLHPADADADGHPTARDHIDRRQRLGVEHRVPVRHDHDARNNSQRLGAAGDERHQRQLLETFAFADELALDGVGISRVDFGRQDDVIRDHHRGESHSLGRRQNSREIVTVREGTASWQVKAVTHPMFPLRVRARPCLVAAIRNHRNSIELTELQA